MTNKQPTGIEEKILFKRVMTREGYAYDPVDMQKLIETTRREAVKQFAEFYDNDVFPEKGYAKSTVEKFLQEKPQ